MTKFKNFLHLSAINSLQNINKLIFLLLAGVLLLTMCFISKDAGINIDEHFHVDHAENVLKYYTSLGRDKTALFNEQTLHLYGQSLDNLVCFFNKAFNIDDVYRTRHFFGSIAGWILILYTGLIAAQLFGWQAGYIALFFMFFSPRIVGHSFNNLKDIPFASAYIFTIYYLILFLKQLPEIKFKTLLLITLGIAWSISIRIGGIILIPYFILFYGLYYILQKGFYKPEIIKTGVRVIAIIAGVSTIGYFLGLLLWPYGLQNPIKNPFLTLTSMTNYNMNLNQLFEGKMYPSQSLPWYYGIKYIIISSPIVVGVGLILFLVRLKVEKNDRSRKLSFFIIFFAFIFPLAYTIYKHSNLYSGWRHLLWIYGPLVILSSGGFVYFIQSQAKWVKYSSVLLIVVLLIHPVAFSIKNHPYQYTYFNQLVGGIKGAYGKYELDPYYHSLKAGALYLEENGYLNDSVTIVSNSDRVVIDALYNTSTKANIKYCRYFEKSKNNWDYAIWANTLITPEQLTEGYWPPKETIYTIDVDGVPIGAVVKRISKEDYQGFEALNNEDASDAKKHFKNFLKVYPKNEEAYEGLAQAMFLERKLDSTVIYADSSLLYNPRQFGSSLLKATALNTNKKYSEALSACNELLEMKKDVAPGYYQKGIALKNLNRPTEAIEEFQNATIYNKEYYQAFMQVAEIMVNSNEFKNAISIYNQVLQFKKNDLFATVYSAKCYHLLGDNQMAEKILSSLSNKDQYNYEVIKLKLRLALSHSDQYSCVNYLNMVKNVTLDSELFVLRAMFVLRQNKIDEAILLSKKAIELDPINQEAQTLLKSITDNQANTKSRTTQQETETQPQSIMFQKPKAKKQTSPFKVPAK